MSYQSLSICVPAGCLNNCKFCVARIHRDDKYKKQIIENKRFYHLYSKEFIEKMNYARDNGADTVILTGDGEPLLNYQFIKEFGFFNKLLNNPFLKIELQTSGTTLINNDSWYLRFLREHVGIKTISLSLSNIFDSKRNAEINCTKKGHEIDIDKTCAEIKRYDFTLRLSLNMTSDYDTVNIEELFNRARQLGASQLTFRILYSNNSNTEQNIWIKENSASEKILTDIKEYILNKGRALEKLSFGATRYSVNGISVVIDEDCMSTTVKEESKYLILRPDCKLYTKWDDDGSILF